MLQLIGCSLRRRRQPGNARTDQGFSMIEVIVSMVLFLLIAAASASLLIATLHSTKESRNRTQAASVASEQIENFRDLASISCAWHTPLPTGCKASKSIATPGTTTSTQTVGGTVFTIAQTTAYEAKSTPSGSCAASTTGGSAGVQPVLDVREKVSWPTMTVKPVTTETILAPPVGAFSGNSGSLDAGVVDSQQHPVAGATVSVVSSTGVTNTYTTDANGCAFAAYLVPGSYTVNVSKAGYVDTQELSTSTQTVGVSTGNVTTATFYYDLAASLRASFVAAPSWPTGTPFVTPTSPAMAVTVGNSGLGSTGTYSLPNPTTGTSVYPYSSGYAVWAGRCPEANPDAVTTTGTPLYPVGGQPPTPTTVTTTAGGSATAAVPLYPLTVQVSDGTRPTSPVTLSFVEKAGGAQLPCTAPFTTYTLGAAHNSNLLVIGVPLGLFTLTGNDGTKASSPMDVNVGLNGAGSSSAPIIVSVPS